MNFLYMFKTVLKVEQVLSAMPRRNDGSSSSLIKTKKQVTWVFISTYGLAQNEYSLEMIHQSLTLDDLF